MTYIVSSGALNSTHSLTHTQNLVSGQKVQHAYARLSR